MKLSSLKDGDFAISNVTEIVYGRKEGVLIKFPTYSGADRNWRESLYSLDANHFKAIKKKDLTQDVVKKYKGFKNV